MSGYFHTDLANAYFGAPVRNALKAHLPEWSELAEDWSAKIAGAVESGATNYFGSLFRRCDLMFAATAAQAERLRDYGVVQPRVVPLGVDVDRFHPRRRSTALRAKLGADENTVVLIYAGRLDTEKQVPVLFDAFAQLRLPRTMLIVVGEGPMRGALEARARELPRVHVLPFEPDVDAFATLLASSDIYVTAGPHETFGLSVIEAQASGLPVVGVAAGALLERVVPGTGLLGSVADPLCMARNIETVAAQRHDFGRFARQQVESGGCAWTKAFDALISTYERTLSDPTGASLAERDGIFLRDA